jgi:hypothetical protein
LQSRQKHILQVTTYKQTLASTQKPSFVISVCIWASVDGFALVFVRTPISFANEQSIRGWNSDLAAILKTQPFRVKKPGTVLALNENQVNLWERSMADVIFIVVTVIFFIISWLYVIGCDRL